MIKLAYLISQYPAISHAFIMREILFLRTAGVEIHPISINDQGLPEEGLSHEEQEEIRNTYYIKKQGISKALRAFTLALFTTPISFFRGLAFSFSLAGWDLKRLLWHFFYFCEALMIGTWMREKGLTHLHVHFASPAGTVGMIVTRVFGITHSLTVHGPDDFYDVTLHSLKKKVEMADFIVCIGAFARSQLMRLSPPFLWKKLEISPLGVDTAYFSPPFLKKKLGPLEILCVGRLVPTKGQHILLEAFSMLVREGKEIRLRLIGDGPDRESLQRAAIHYGIDSKVIFEGAQNQSRVIEAYRAADIFALASFGEGIPVVLMEAMSMEIPCVATQIAGIPELIRDQIDGLLVIPSDTKELAEALRKLSSDSSLREKLGAAGRKRVVEKFEIKANIKRLEQIFNSHLTPEKKR